jgi:hypothetical protein
MCHNSDRRVVFRDRYALDIPHHTVGQSIFGDRSVDQSGDEWVLEMCQNPPFLPETIQRQAGIHAALQQFDGDLLLELVIGTNA